MSNISDAGLKKLISLLPLPERHAALPPELQRLHAAFLRSLVERGRPLSTEEMETLAPGGDVVNALWTLAANDLIVLDALGRAVGAYPVTVEQTPHRVRVNGNDISAMCAFDAVSVAPMFGTETVVHSRCPMTGEPILIEQHGRRIKKVLPSPAVMVGIWWRNPGSVAARNFCPGIVFLRDGAAAQAWRAVDIANRDTVSLEDAVDAGTRFFEPLLEEKPVGLVTASV
jgi:hypothetical protein